MDAVACCPFCCLKVHYFSEIRLFDETVNSNFHRCSLAKREKVGLPISHYFSEIHLFDETVNFSKYNPKKIFCKFFHTFYEIVNFCKMGVVVV